MSSRYAFFRVAGGCVLHVLDQKHALPLTLCGLHTTTFPGSLWRTRTMLDGHPLERVRRVHPQVCDACDRMALRQGAA